MGGLLRYYEWFLSRSSIQMPSTAAAFSMKIRRSRAESKETTGAEQKEASKKDRLGLFSSQRVRMRLPARSPTSHEPAKSALALQFRDMEENSNSRAWGVVGIVGGLIAIILSIPDNDRSGATSAPPLASLVVAEGHEGPLSRAVLRFPRGTQ
jgi:hypothetical protein